MRCFILLALCSLSAWCATLEKVRLIWRDDPTATACVAWCGDEGTVAYGLRGEQLSQEAPLSQSTSYKGMQHRFVRLSGLQPDSAYDIEIRVGDQQASYWFRTAPAEAKPFTFIAGGDSRNHHDARRNANRMVAKLRPLFVAFGGDMTNRDTDEEWNQWFDDWELTTTDDKRLIPIVPARGNHERSNDSISQQFDAPNRSITYALAIGGDFFRLYTLNSEIEPAGEQGAWLADDLAAHESVHWKVAQYHRPMRPHVSRKKERLEQYNAWAGLFHQHGLAMIMECDAHCVKVTWPVRPSTDEGSAEGFIRDDATGTVYAGEGCWGAPLRAADDAKPWTRASGSFNQFKWVHVHPDRMDLHTVAIDTAEQVGSNSEDDVFARPSELMLWEVDGADLISIPAR